MRPGSREEERVPICMLLQPKGIVITRISVRAG